MPALGQLGPAEEVASADHDGHLDALAHHGGQLARQPADHVGVDAEAPGAEHLAGQLHHDPPIRPCGLGAATQQRGRPPRARFRLGFGPSGDVEVVRGCHQPLLGSSTSTRRLLRPAGSLREQCAARTGLSRSCRTSRLTGTPQRPAATQAGRCALDALDGSGADPEAGETGRADAGLLEDLGHGLALVAGVLLLEQDVLLVEARHPALDDLRAGPARASPPPARSARRSAARWPRPPRARRRDPGTAAHSRPRASRRPGPPAASASVATSTPICGGRSGLVRCR